MRFDYDFVLEIANGFGFVLATVLFLSLGTLLVRRLIVCRGRVTDEVTKLTMGMTIVKLGLMVGLGERWLVRQCDVRTPENCAGLESTSWLLLASVILIAIGGWIILNVLAPPNWRPWACISALVVSFVIPFSYYAAGLMFPLQAVPGSIVHGHYQLDRVALSILIAVLGSYTALEVAQHSRTSTGWRRAVWLWCAAIVLSWAIWSMHFMAMLAFDVPGVAVTYNVWLTLLSLALPIAFTLIGFISMAMQERTWLTLTYSAVMIAFGIVTMHYVGMSAMEMPARPTYDITWVIVSIVIAVAASIAALWLAFIETTKLQQLLAALIMGVVGICGLHYSAMVAYQMHMVSAKATVPRVPISSLTQDEMAFWLVIASAAIFFAFILISVYDHTEEDRHGKHNRVRKS